MNPASRGREVAYSLYGEIAKVHTEQALQRLASLLAAGGAGRHQGDATLPAEVQALTPLLFSR
jgi:hypothetical protein